MCIRDRVKRRGWVTQSRAMTAKLMPKASSDAHSCVRNPAAVASGCSTRNAEASSTRGSTSRVAAMATMDVLENGGIENAATQGAYMMARLDEMATRHPSMGDVRGVGLMVGVEFVHDKATKAADARLRNRIVEVAFEHGLLAFDIVGGFADQDLIPSHVQRPRDRLAILDQHGAVGPFRHDLDGAAGFSRNLDPHQPVAHPLQHRTGHRRHPRRIQHLRDRHDVGRIDRHRRARVILNKSTDLSPWRKDNLIV